MSNKTMYASASVLGKLLADQHVPDALYDEACAAYNALTAELRAATARGEIRSADGSGALVDGQTKPLSGREALERNAARYLWLRGHWLRIEAYTNHGDHALILEVNEFGGVLQDNARLDAAIDAAMSPPLVDEGGEQP